MSEDGGQGDADGYDPTEQRDAGDPSSEATDPASTATDAATDGSTGPDTDGDVGVAPDQSPDRLAARLADRMRAHTLAAHRREAQATQNIREGVAFFNNQGYVPPDHKHTPSRLHTCPRKAYYELENAPAEDPTPEGLFWTGTRIEEDLVVPWLAALLPEDLYVQAEAYISVEIDTGPRPLLLKGATDPCIVEADGTILLPTEIKTVHDLAALDGPKRRHRAQLLAYLYALSHDDDQNHPDDLRTGLLVYVARTTLEIRVFTVELTVETWSPVLQWARELTDHRVERSLPPADPPAPGMCEYCPYRRRCGQTDHDVADAPIQGLVPGHVYPRERLEAYLQAHDEAVLTPTCAHQYPDLASDHPVAPWRCQHCDRRYEWNAEAIDWEDTDRPPRCPVCEGTVLEGPAPGEQ